MEQMIAWLVETIGRMGYPGIIALMFLESSFIPFPSEVVIPPAGYLASRGEMNIYLVVLSGVVGSLLGAFFNYYIALFLGRPLLLKYGRYLFLPPERFEKVDRFFQVHGEVSTFVCRLLPGIRQYISFPAGLARMNLMKFSFYTALGAGIWVVVLAWIGYFVGNNMDLVKQYSHQATLVLAVGITVLLYVYVRRYLAKMKNRGKCPEIEGNE
ncbi:MAG: DedA family protein [Desulfomonilia bacterium]|jgi:membrane protein DedA with SNARE-associated domain